MKPEQYNPVELTLAERWREQYNPLVGLNFRVIAGWLQLQQYGAVADIQWLYRQIERRDATLAGVVARRLSGIGRLDWSIKQIPEKDLPQGGTVAMAKKQAAALRNAYDRIDNLQDAFKFGALSKFRGHSHLEKHYDSKGNVVHLESVPQWNWARSGVTGPWWYNERALSIYGPSKDMALDPNLKEIDPTDFLIFESEYPINEIAVLCFMRKSMAQKDWDAYLEIFGINPRFVELPPDAPLDAQGNVNSAYMELAQKTVSGSSGVLPSGAKMADVDVGQRGAPPMPLHIRYQDEQIVLAGTGGLLTMLSQSGSGTLAGKAHKDTFEQLIEADALDISEVFQNQFDAQVLEGEFEGQPVCAYFQLESKEQIDATEVADNALKFANAGYEVDPAQLEERSGYRLSLRQPVSKTANTADAGNTTVQKVPQTENRLRRFLNRIVGAAATDRVLGKVTRHITDASDAALAPMVNRINALLNGPEDQFEAGAKKLIADVPKLLKEIESDPEAIKAWQDSLAAQLLNGLAKPRGKK